MNSFYSEIELAEIGLKSYGRNVLISKKASIYGEANISIGNNVRIDDFCILSGKITLGNFIHISAYTALYGGNKGITIEDFSTVSSKVSVYSVSDDYSGRSMTNPMIPYEFKPEYIEKEVLLKRHVIVGAGSVLLPGIVIEEGSSVGAMSLCNKSTEPWSVNAGIPAQRIRDREKDILLLEKKFLEKNYEQS